MATPGACGGRDYVPPVGEDLRVAVEVALRTARRTRPLAEGNVPGLVAAAGPIRGVVEAVDAGNHAAAADLLNTMLRDSGARPHLMCHDGQPWHPHFHGADDDPVTGWVAGMATGLAVVLGSEHADRLGVCSASLCDRVFVDVSRNGARRFCGVACQSRVKAAAYRARRSASTSSSGRGPSSTCE